MARTKKAGLEGEFKHKTSVGKNGELLFDAPIEIVDDADMMNFGISDSDCRYLHFGRSEKIRVYFYKTTNRDFAQAQWEHINNQHSREYFRVRCMVPGRRKSFVKCRDTNKCTECPYGRTPETKQAQEVYLDGLIESGWEPATEESVEHQVMVKMEYQAIRALMDLEDPRIALAFEARVLFGESVKEIAADLGVSEPRIYQLIAIAKTIGKEYRKING